MDEQRRWRIVWTDEEQSVKVDGVDVSADVESLDINFNGPFVSVTIRLHEPAVMLEMEVTGDVVRSPR